MRDLSEDYVNNSKAAARDVFVKIMLNDEEDTVFDTKSLLPISANRSITDGSFGVGFSLSDRLTFSVAAEDKVPKKTRTTLYAAFSKNGTYERLGRFYCESSRRNGNIISVTAFDAMNILRNRTVKFTGISSKDIPELTFPCSMQSVLDYIVAKNGLTCEFVCEDFTVQEKPMRNETEYYSDAEILGFIASSHARNAKFDYEGKLAFVGYTAVDSAFTASNVIDMSLDDSEPFEVTGLLFKIGDDTIYIDDVEGSEYDEEAEGVLKIENPFASVEIAEYVWSQLGGLTYYGGSITIRGAGIHECGDVITVKNLKNPSDTTEYPFCITSIDYSIGNDGFIEVLSSRITKSGGTSLSSGGNSSSSGGGKTYFAGEGLSLTSDNAFKLNIANQGDIGGLRIAAGERILEGDATAELGIYKGSDAFPALRSATRFQKGGLFLGDGLVPVFEEDVNSNGDTIYSASDSVQLRLGDGLEFVDNDEISTDTKELRENHYGGRKVSVKIDGKTLKLNDKGELTAEGYVEGTAIAFRVAGEQISINVRYDDTTLKVKGGSLGVNIDNETIRLNDDNELESIGVTIENGVVVSEADASYLIHEYEEVKYVKGNKIGYSGPTSKIVCQGYVFDSLTPDKYTIGSDILYGTTLDIRLSANVSTPPQTVDVHVDAEYDVSYPNRANCYLVCSALNYRSAVGYYYDGVFGIYFKWDSIHAPNDNFPYGYIKGKAMMPGKASTSATNFYNAAQLAFTAYFPFATEAEYNAAVGLTYEPLTLQQVNETVTEV